MLVDRWQSRQLLAVYTLQWTRKGLYINQRKLKKTTSMLFLEITLPRRGHEAVAYILRPKLGNLIDAACIGLVRRVAGK